LEISFQPAGAFGISGQPEFRRIGDFSKNRQASMGKNTQKTKGLHKEGGKKIQISNFHQKHGGGSCGCQGAPKYLCITNADFSCQGPDFH
jgi:hypothetical protein